MLFLCVRLGCIAKAKNGFVCNRGHIGGGMAYLYRLVGYLLFVFTLCFAFASPARALSPEYDWTLLSNNGYYLGVVRGYDAACAAVTARYAQGGSCVMNGPAQIDYITAVNNRYYAAATRQQVPYEPANSTCSADSCTCKVGYSLNSTASACMVKPSAASGGACVTVCYNGSCSADPSCGASLVGPYGSTPNTPNDCGAGLAYGSVNGLNVCVKPDFTSSMKMSSSTSSVSTDSAATPSPSTIQSTETTTCTSYQCKTETTSSSTPPGGGASTVSTQTKLEPKEDFCTKNPRAATCITSSAGGSCAAGFSCDGDAIQCSIAKTAFATNCAFTARSGESDLYDASKLTGNRTTDLPGNSSVSIGSGSFDQSNALGVAASCMPDVNIVVMSRPITLPFSNVCQYFEVMGNILLACSLILAARIVSRG